MRHGVRRVRERVREQGLGFFGAAAVMAKSFLQNDKRVLPVGTRH